MSPVKVAQKVGTMSWTSLGQSSGHLPLAEMNIVFIFPCWFSRESITKHMFLFFKGLKQTWGQADGSLEDLR